VAQINETFSRNFQQMAVAGEVSLGMSNGKLKLILFGLLMLTSLPMFLHSSDEHDMNYDQFGILIKVKFR